MFFTKNSLAQRKTTFKKRGILSTSLKDTLEYSQGLVYLPNRAVVELNVLRGCIVALKRAFKKVRLSTQFCLRKNHVLSKKVKNSRMGKGKGKFLRYAYRPRPSRPLIILSGVGERRSKATRSRIMIAVS